MESLNTLANSLTTNSPPSLIAAEKELLNNFKAAALSITTLYRSSRHTSKRAFNAGYASACQDLLMMIQQGVSDGGIGTGSDEGHSDAHGMTVGKVMDWIEARLDAIKAREEEEDEDEEREKEREHARTERASAPTKPHNRSGSPPVSVISKPKDHGTEPATTTRSPAPVAQPSSATASSPPRPTSLPLQTLVRLSRSKHNNKEKDFPVASASTFPAAVATRDASPSADVPFAFLARSAPAETPVTEISAGSKRRHGLMMMLDSPASASPLGALSVSSALGGSGPTNSTISTSGPGTRRRTRSTRGLPPSRALHDQNTNQSGEAMDVEEEGRERKRVARR